MWAMLHSMPEIDPYQSTYAMSTTTAVDRRCARGCLALRPAAYQQLCMTVTYHYCFV